MEYTVFVLKKLISVVIYPLGTFFCLLLFSFIAIHKGRRKLGYGLMILGASWLIISSLTLVGQIILAPLENLAGPPADVNELKANKVKYIVILGGGTESGAHPDQVVAGNSTIKRFLEGWRLWKGIPGSKMILSGGSPIVDGVGCAEAMANLAYSVGVPESSIILETDSWDTGGQARLLKPVLGFKKFALVTSAYHMPRSMELFKAEGLDPMPAPADFLASRKPINYSAFLPRCRGVEFTEKAIHEYVGITVAKLKMLTRF